MSAAFLEIFAELRAIMLEAAPGMTVAEDSPGNLTLRTHWIEARTGQPAWFGWIAIKKSYVAYHIMPLYTLAALEAAVPEGLARRRQGKTCFNVKIADEAVFAQLRQLTALAARMEPDLRAAIGA